MAFEVNNVMFGLSLDLNLILNLSLSNYFSSMVPCFLKLFLLSIPPDHHVLDIAQTDSTSSLELIQYSGIVYVCC